jgi:hypothetical protein
MSSMTRAQWTALMREATSHLTSDADKAAFQLTDLVERTTAAVEQSVEAWHVRQTLSLLAEIEKDRGRLEESARIDLESASHAEASAVEARQTAATAYANAALRHFELGQEDRAMQLARRAFEAGDVYRDPSIVFETLLSKVRKVRQAESMGSA